MSFRKKCATAGLAVALIAAPLAPASAADGSFYRWGKTCAWQRVSGQDHTNKVWAERRQDIWFGWLNMGCKLTGFKKTGYGSPISPWYNDEGVRIR